MNNKTPNVTKKTKNLPNPLLHHILPGILLCLALAIPANLLGQTFPIIGAPVIAIIIGILISFILPKLTTSQYNNTSLDPGIKYTSKKLLQYSIILLGFQLNLYNLLRVGGQALLLILFAMAIAFITAFAVSKALKLPKATATLIGVGTAICGGSAIAAAAPAIRAKDEYVSQAISTIFLFNIIGVLTFPAIGMISGMDHHNFGTWAGVAINDTSSVVAAGTAWSIAWGADEALQIATITKLTRTLMIIPVTFALAVYTSRKQGHDNGDFSLVKSFPWFVLFFAAAAMINTFAGIPASWSAGLTDVGRFVIIMAMAAIGLGTNLKKLFSYGFKPIFLGASCWVLLAGASFLVIMG